MINLDKEFKSVICEKVRTLKSADSLKTIIFFILNKYSFPYLFLQEIYTLMKHLPLACPAMRAKKKEKERILMRRENYEIFMEGSFIGLLSDCVYYCWQNSEITDEESYLLDCFLDDLYKEERKNHG